MKRLLCILNSLNAGGAETFMIKNLREWVKEKEYIIDFIVATSTPGYYDNEVRSLGGIIYNIPLHTRHPIRAFRCIKKIVKENNYKYVLKLCNTPIGIFDLLAARSGGAKRIGVRSCNAITNEKLFRRIINSILRKPLNKMCDFKIAPSDLAATYTFGDKEEVVLINNGLDIDMYKFDYAYRLAIRKEFQIEDKFVIGHVGKFGNQKNHYFLIDFFAKLLEKENNCILLLIGDGELKDKIKEYVKKRNIENNVIFAGVRKDIPQLLSAMDIFVLPSFYEGMPNCAIEAQANGLECFLADTITKQADITGNVKYLPISDEKIWVKALSAYINRKSNERARDMRKLISNSGYDIKFVSEKLKAIIFEDVEK